MLTSTKNKRKCHATITKRIATVNKTNKRVQIRMRAYLLCIPLVEHTEVLINLSLSPFHSQLFCLCFTCSCALSVSRILHWPFSHSVGRLYCHYQKMISFCVPILTMPKHKTIYVQTIVLKCIVMWNRENRIASAFLMIIYLCSALSAMRCNDRRSLSFFCFVLLVCLVCIVSSCKSRWLAKSVKRPNCYVQIQIQWLQDVFGALFLLLLSIICSKESHTNIIRHKTNLRSMYDVRLLLCCCCCCSYIFFYYYYFFLLPLHLTLIPKLLLPPPPLLPLLLLQHTT